MGAPLTSSQVEEAAAAAADEKRARANLNLKLELHLQAIGNRTEPGTERLPARLSLICLPVSPARGGRTGDTLAGPAGT